MSALHCNCNSMPSGHHGSAVHAPRFKSCDSLHHQFKSSGLKNLLEHYSLDLTFW